MERSFVSKIEGLQLANATAGSSGLFGGDGLQTMMGESGVRCGRCSVPESRGRVAAPGRLLDQYVEQSQRGPSPSLPALASGMPPAEWLKGSQCDLGLGQHIDAPRGLVAFLGAHCNVSQPLLSRSPACRPNSIAVGRRFVQIVHDPLRLQGTGRCASHSASCDVMGLGEADV